MGVNLIIPFEGAGVTTTSILPQLCDINNKETLSIRNLQLRIFIFQIESIQFLAKSYVVGTGVCVASGVGVEGGLKTRRVERLKPGSIFKLAAAIQHGS